MQAQLEKFWEIEDYSESPTKLTQKEMLAEKIFQETHTRDTDGKFIVSLPFKTKPPNIGETQHLAISRFASLERKFHRDESFRIAYSKFMRDYLELGHMRLAKRQDTKGGAFLPHFGVINNNSTTTRVRAVFDASVKSGNGLSINDNLIVGPNLQKDIFSLLVRCRQFQFVLSADIIKMFRQIWVAEEDWEYQKILWRPRADEELQTFCLMTLWNSMCAILSYEMLKPTSN